MSLFAEQPEPVEEQRPMTVTEVTLRAKKLLQEAFPQAWVTGEISNFHHHGSGHMYFSLKDGTAVLPCAMFKREAARLSFRPRDGMQVEARGKITLYEVRGNYQMIVDQLSEAGRGALQQRLEELKARLLAEGLFDAARKRPLPAFPARVGVVTSPTGAVLHDIIRVTRRRWPGTQIILIAVKVQGEGAAEEVARAIELFNRARAADVLIVGRGGGSLEDLWAFNEEIVVRAVCASRIPVISAVGHETDVTLCDFAADLRAPTPSAAAERAVPDRLEYRGRVASVWERMLRATFQGLERRRQSVKALRESYALGRPRELLARRMQQIDELERRLARAAEVELGRARERLARNGARLAALSPAEVLARGFCYVQRVDDGRRVDSASSLAVEDRVRLILKDGRVQARVEAIESGGGGSGEWRQGGEPAGRLGRSGGP